MWPHDLIGSDSQRENLPGAPYGDTTTPGSGLLASSGRVVAGIERAHPLLGGCPLGATTASQTIERTLPPDDPRGVRTR